MSEAVDFPVEKSISDIARRKDAPERLAKWNAAPDECTKIIVTLDRSGPHSPIEHLRAVGSFVCLEGYAVS